MLPTTFQFIKDNWVLIRVLWDDIDHNSFYHYNIRIYNPINDKFSSDNTLYDKIVKKRDVSKVPWSCIFAADFILDLYKVYSRDEPVVGNIAGFNHLPTIKVSDVNSFDKDFQSGFIYKFSIINHEFVVIYLSEQEIYYTDYYSETERSEYYRFESMERQHFLDYLKNYLNSNIMEHVKFHQGSEKYHSDCCNDFAQQSPEVIYAKLPITFNPSVKYVIQVLENSVTDEEVIKELEDDDLSYAEWKSMRNKCLAYLKM